MSEHSARHLRRILRAYLQAWEMPELVDAGTLALTELIANVVRHVPGRHCAMRILRQPQGLRVEVTDVSPEMPKPHAEPVLYPPDMVPAPEELDEAGRGLLLLVGVVDRWGVEARADGEPGKTVWFECDALSQRNPQGTSPT